MRLEELLGLLILAVLVEFLQHGRLVLEVARRVDEIEQEEQFGATLVLDKADGVGLICLLDGPGALQTLLQVEIVLLFGAIFLVVHVYHTEDQVPAVWITFTCNRPPICCGN